VQCAFDFPLLDHLGDERGQADLDVGKLIGEGRMRDGLVPARLSQGYDHSL
jgi:hypothetical protein